MSSEQQAPPVHAVDIEAIHFALESLRTDLAQLDLAAGLDAIRAELHDLRAELAAVRELFIGVQPGAVPIPQATALPEQLVTLDQIGAMVHRSKRSMDRYRQQMPAPRVQGRRGRSHLWAWPEIRPWLETTFSVQLPERFPGLSH